MFNFLKRRKQPAVPVVAATITNEEWQHGLAPPPDSAMLELLREHLVRGLRPALANYIDRQLPDFIEDTAQDAMLVILEKMDSFRGESRFTTWALKIAVRQGLSELRRKKWKDVSLDQPAGSQTEQEQAGHAETYMGEAARAVSDPSQHTHEQLMLDKVMNIMHEVLTEKQRTAIRALMIQEMPIVVVAQKMGMSQNALYKLVHDARLKLKKRLHAEGIALEDLYA